MRVSPIAWLAQRLDDCLSGAEAQAQVTHDTPDGITGSKAIAAAVFIARRHDKAALGRQVKLIAPDYRLGWPPSGKPGASARKAVPAAIASFLNSSDFEDCIRRAVSLGGDSDSVASMAGAIAEAYYGDVPEHIGSQVLERLPNEMAEVLERFRSVVRNNSSRQPNASACGLLGMRLSHSNWNLSNAVTDEHGGQPCRFQ